MHVYCISLHVNEWMDEGMERNCYWSETNMTSHKITCGYIYIYIEKDRYEGVCIYTYQTCTQQLTVDLIYIYIYVYKSMMLYTEMHIFRKVSMGATTRVSNCSTPDSRRWRCRTSWILGRILIFFEIQSSNPVEETNMTMETIWKCTFYRKVVMFQFAIVGPISFSASFCWSHETMQNRWARIS